MLAQFENSLGTISSDIRSLQAQSTELTHRLENRKQVIMKTIVLFFKY